MKKVRKTDKERGMLAVHKEGKNYVVRDETGTLYGPPVGTREEAEALLADWKNYYETA